MTPPENDRDPWHAEADAFAGGLEARDYEVAGAAELPDELQGHVVAADEDPEFQKEMDEWFEHLMTDDDHTPLLAL
ncbi:MAG TPA: hypothetical protein PKA88_19305, partial [Polyangiaceae bacterium]|nr:hypothetical protein [Polyangiaceae bacterium]